MRLRSSSGRRRSRRHEDDKGLVEIVPRCEWQPGQKVRIIAGALIDKMGIFQCWSDSERVMVLLDILGATVPVRLPEQTVAAYC